MSANVWVRGGGVLVLALTCALGWARSAAQEALLTGVDARDGTPIELKLGPQDRFAVLAFVSVHCLCSPDQMMELKDLQGRWRARGFRFALIDVSQDSKQSDRQKYYRSFDFPIFWDRGFKISEHFKVAKTPWVQVIDASGLAVHGGTVLDNDGRPLLEPALRSLAAGQAPEVVPDKRFGCALRPVMLMPDDSTDGSK